MKLKVIEFDEILHSLCIIFFNIINFYILQHCFKLQQIFNSCEYIVITFFMSYTFLLLFYSGVMKTKAIKKGGLQSNIKKESKTKQMKPTRKLTKEEGEKHMKELRDIFNSVGTSTVEKV